MPTKSRRLPSVLAVLGLTVALLGPLLGSSPATAVGTGAPVIVTPVEGESYHIDEVPDLHLDFDDAPYGDYRFEVVKAPDTVVLAGDVVHSEAVDPEAFYELSLTEVNAYTVTVYGATDDVLATTTFGTFDLGEPPLEPCDIVVPSKVVAVSPTTAVYPRFENCSGRNALWSVTRKSGASVVGVGFLGIKDGASRGPFKYRDSAPTGTYGVVPTGVDQNTTSTVIKFGSRISLAGSRASRTRVPLSGVATRYVPSADAFKAWGNRPIAISYKDCAVCPWKFLATDRTDAAGRWGLTVISSTVRYYRATVGETATAWGRTSAPIRR